MDNQIDPAFLSWVKEFNVSSQYDEHQVRETREKLKNIYYYKFGGFEQTFTKLFFPLRLNKLAKFVDQK